MTGHFSATAAARHDQQVRARFADALADGSQLMEQHQRCRYWPQCAIHTGVPVNQEFERSVDHGAKLSDEQVTEIRQRSAAGVKHVRLAEEYGVGPSMISKIVHGAARRSGR